MFERILLPLDGSELAEMSIPYGEELAHRLGSEIILYHVYGHEHRFQAHMRQVYLDRLADNIRQNVKNGEATGGEVKVTTEVAAGEPTENICNLVNKNRVDLIIMTAVSASGLKIGKMLGSVTDHLCRTVPAPVLLIRQQDLPRIESKKQLINRILIPLDGSELSKLALPVGEELASRLKVRITLFQMAALLRMYDYGYGMGYNAADSGYAMKYNVYSDYAKLEEVEKKRVAEQMVALEAELKQKGFDVNYRITSGTDATNEIIKAGKEAGADLTVMSTHGRSGLDRWVLGSVTEKILRYGEMPLLLVNAKAS
jgi:nucleotide-binding universal stress UspA family protein